ncbi:hypothetical protein GCM10022206_14180 [Streptomyces chiangmaiensis]
MSHPPQAPSALPTNFHLNPKDEPLHRSSPQPTTFSPARPVTIGSGPLAPDDHIGDREAFSAFLARMRRRTDFEVHATGSSPAVRATCGLCMSRATSRVESAKPRGGRGLLAQPLGIRVT